jgi:hypothetical protein
MALTFGTNRFGFPDPERVISRSLRADRVLLGIGARDTAVLQGLHPARPAQTEQVDAK